MFLSKQNHEKNVDDRKKTLRELKRIIKEKAEENSALTKELEELNVSVNERRHIHEVNGKYIQNICTHFYSLLLGTVNTEDLAILTPKENIYKFSKILKVMYDHG